MKNIWVCVTMDNWFTSVYLAQRLYAIGVYLLGTIGAPAKRIGKPTKFSMPICKIENNDAKQLHIKSGWYRQCFMRLKNPAGVFVNDCILVTQWKDSKILCFISTVYNEQVPVIAARRRSGQHTKEQVASTPVQNNYAKTYMGVDKMDQMMGYYSIVVELADGTTG